MKAAHINPDPNCQQQRSCAAKTGTLCYRCHRARMARIMGQRRRAAKMARKGLRVGLRIEYRAVGLFSAPIKQMTAEDAELVRQFLARRA